MVVCLFSVVGVVVVVVVGVLIWKRHEFQSRNPQIEKRVLAVMYCCEQRDHRDGGGGD